MNIDAAKLLQRYQSERIATEDACDQAVRGLVSAVDYFREVMVRKGGMAMAKDLTMILEAEQNLCEGITDLQRITSLTTEE